MSYMSLCCVVLEMFGDDKDGDQVSLAGSVWACGIACELGEWVASCAGW
jgi:hypothetical protein